MDENSLKNTISTPKSGVKEETKDKFDALLRQALNSKSRKEARNQSTQKLITDVESLTSSNENLPGKSNLSHQAVEIVEVDVHEDFARDNFILNKFLNDNSNMRETVNDKEVDELITVDVNDPDVLFIKPPVPRPRKNKIVNSSSTSSTGTYKVASRTSAKGTGDNSGIEVKTVGTKIDSNESLSTIISKTVNKIDNVSPGGASQASFLSSIKTEVLKATESITDFSDKASEKSRSLNPNNDQIKYENEVKPKRKKRHASRRQDALKNVVESVIKNQEKTRYTYEEIIGITVHKTDRLKLDSLVIHPVVKIHLVNSETGEYLSKSDKNRPVVFYYENKDIAFITPVISEPYNLYEKRSLYPEWEETVIINEDINFLITYDKNPIIFFEIMDFVSFAVANSQFSQKGSSKGWHKIAWAFLKPLGKNNISNVNKKARLQLYYPGKHKKKILPHICDMFHWWQGKKIKYPSSLYVTVKGMIPPEKIIETLRSKTPIHGEKASRMTLESQTDTELSSSRKLSNKSANESKSDVEVETDNREEKLWSRLSYQACKLPNKCLAELSSYEEGCLAMKFSNDGLYLACAVLSDDTYSIIIFSVKSHEEVCKYSGHQGLIHNINWSKDDQIVVTASADCTVCLWSFSRNNFIEMLPHPSYVYASEISSKNVIATGCYDQIVRIWCPNATGYNLLQELEGHKGYITSLCFNKKSAALYSADSLGTIIEWKLKAAENTWNLKRELKLTDLRDTIINQILLHVRERRLVIHARDSILRIMDLKTGCVLYWLQGAVNNRFKTTCSFSPCGNYIFAGSENGLINVWNADLGHLMATYSLYDAFNYRNLPVHCVQFHTHDNILAASHYGHSLPILLVVYDPDLEGKSNVGLKMLHSHEESVLPKRAESKLTVRKLIADGGTSPKKEGKIKFEDIMQKIDEIVNPHNSGSSRSSVNN